MIHGVGVGLRHEIYDELSDNLHHIDFIECNMGPTAEGTLEFLAPFVNKLPIAIHSLTLSLGSVNPPFYRMERLKEVVQSIKPAWVTEHLSFSHNENIEINSFIPLPYIDEAIEVVSANIRTWQREMNVPVAMENITNDFRWPGSKYTESEFITKVAIKADCGILLDLTNLYINAKTIKYDPYEYLEALPKDRILQLHIAGHTERDDGLIDSHVGGIHPEVLKLLAWVLNNTDCNAVLIERDSNLYQFSDLLPDIKVCKELYNKHRCAVGSF